MAGWENPEAHGKSVRSNGVTNTSACAASCHGENLEGGIGPSCKKCHEGYPHSEGWGQKENHGAWVSANSKDACATKCHGSDLGGGLSGVSCDACHTLWPAEHKNETWQTTLHGKKFLGLGKGACLGCHGEDWKGGKTGFGCGATCHNSLPQHYDDALWGETGHGKYALTLGGDLADCKKCHGENFEGKVFGEAGVSDIPACSNCHQSYPALHTEEWKTKYEGHGKYLLVDKKDDKTECVKCHGEDYKGGGVGKGCYKENCHVTYPHLADWSAGSGHGAYVLQNEKDKQQKTCATANCHGANLGGNPEGSGGAEKLVYGCSDCHYQYPHLPLAQWPLHGKADPTLEKCKTCHGAILAGKGNANSCYECHKTYPDLHQQTGWKTTSAGHGQAIKSGGLSLTDCKICHGTGLDGGVSGKTCSSNDAACHSSYPHPPAGVSNADWPLKAGHGEFALKAGFPQCVACHDKALGDCKKCHHDNVSDWKASVHAQKAAENINGCKVCHGSEIAGGCETCHGAGQSKHKGVVKDDVCCDADENCEPCQINVPYTDKSLHATDHKNNPDKCKICHGDDLKGGISKKSCFSCHDSAKIYPHAAGWGNIATHGVKYLASNAACVSACHGPDLKGGLSKVSCSNSDDVKCHSAYPHGVSWNHGAAVLTAEDAFDKTGFDLKCAGCHGAAEKMNKKMPSTTLKMPVTNLLRCYICHNVYPHLGFKDVADGDDLDATWGKEEGGHYLFFMYNEAYLAEFAGQDPPWKISQLNSVKGCAISSSGCHKVKRKGPFKKGFPIDGVCGALCHKQK